MFPKDIHILLVDDMTGFRFLVSKFLKETGYTNITEAVNGKDALAKMELAQSSKPIGLIISDLKMPVMDGAEFVRNVRGNPTFAKLPVVILTAEGEHSQLRAAAENGISAIIGKPTTLQVFNQKMKVAWDNFSHGVTSGNLKKP